MGTRRVFFHLRVAFFFSQMTRFTSSSSTGSCYRSQSGYTLWVVHLHGYYQIQRPCMGGLGGGCGKSNHKSPTWKLDVRRTFCERGKIWFFFPSSSTSISAQIHHWTTRVPGCLAWKPFYQIRCCSSHGSAFAIVSFSTESGSHK